MAACMGISNGVTMNWHQHLKNIADQQAVAEWLKIQELNSLLYNPERKDFAEESLKQYGTFNERFTFFEKLIAIVYAGWVPI